MAGIAMGIFEGNLTRDPEMRTTPGGKEVCNFCVAVGVSKNDTLFQNCVAWEKKANDIVKYFSKGRPIFVTGNYGKKEEWIDKNTGAQRTDRKLIVVDWHFVGGGKQDDTQQSTAPPTQQNNKPYVAPQDDIPF